MKNSYVQESMNKKRKAHQKEKSKRFGLKFAMIMVCAGDNGGS